MQLILLENWPTRVIIIKWSTKFSSLFFIWCSKSKGRLFFWRHQSRIAFLSGQRAVHHIKVQDTKSEADGPWPTPELWVPYKLNSLKVNPFPAFKNEYVSFEDFFLRWGPRSVSVMRDFLLCVWLFSHSFITACGFHWAPSLYFPWTKNTVFLFIHTISIWHLLKRDISASSDY